MKYIRNLALYVLLFVIIQMALPACAQSKNSANNKKPLVVFVTGDHEYSGESTLPFIAA